MKFLVDNALSPAIARALRDDGHDLFTSATTCYRTHQMRSSFDRAALEHRVVVSADSDFGTLLARRSASTPSLILLRTQAARTPAKQVDLLRANLAAIDEALARGCVAVIEGTRIRVRSLPIVGR